MPSHVPCEMRKLPTKAKAFYSDSRPLQVVPRTPKDVSAADAHDVPMKFPDGDDLLRTGLAWAVADLLNGTEGRT